MKNTNGTVKLLVYIGIILLGFAAVWGAVRHNVVDNTEDIKTIKEVDLPKIDEEKLDNAVFKMYLDQQKEADEKRDTKLDKILDKVLEK